MSRRVPGVLLTGGVGTGKTTVAIELGEALARAGTPHSVIDLDWLAWLLPEAGRGLRVHEVLVRSLAAVWPVHRDAGVQRLVLARSLREAGDLPAIRQAIRDVDLQVVRLTAAPDAVRRRLAGRDTGTVLAEHLAEHETTDMTAAALQLDDFSLSNDGDPQECAARLLRRLGWT